jgi:serine/threonine-protein kinase SRPK3
VWALGCTIYEMITGKILFDPDDYDGNEDRLHLYLIEKHLGHIPSSMVNESRYKDIFYTADQKRIKGFKEFEKSSLKKKINDFISRFPLSNEDNSKKYNSNEDINQIFLNFIIQCLELNYKNRISVIDAVKLIIFE